MMRALYTGELGLLSHQTRMDVVGNNIANVNTVGFKSSRAVFADMLSQNLKYAAGPNGNIGGTDPRQIGLGVRVESTDLLFKDGAPMATGKNTDLCLTGDGLFVVQRGNETYYTRQGNFEFDAAGNYVIPGSGYFVQGWSATDGVIDTTAAVGNVRVSSEQSMAAKATDLVNYYDNLAADVSMVTGISGGVDVVNTVIRTEDVSVDNPLPVDFGGKFFYVVGLSNDLDMRKTWRAKDDIPLGATTADWVNENGETVTATLSPAALFEVPQGSAIGNVYVLTKSSVTEDYPLTVYIDGKSYTATAMSKNLDLTTGWQVSAGGARVGDTAIAITNGSDEVELTLNSPLEESIGRETVTIETKTLVGTAASAENPVIITLSDGTTITETNGVYKVGNSLPVATSVTVYDNSGATHEVPVYFVREGDYTDGVVSSENKWLVSLSPDTSVKKGETTTTEFTDANGNTIIASLDTLEIQFDKLGNLIANSAQGVATDTSGTISLRYASNNETDAESITTQNVMLDFARLTQYAGNTTVWSNGNGNAEGKLKEINIDSSGVITGSYTNGISRPEAQVAVAHFNNAPGLTKTGSSLYQVSANSGAAVVDSSDNLGTNIMAGYLEMSNVDVAGEFADMIITQRGFQSNSKLITVGDEMIQTAVNMKR